MFTSSGSTGGDAKTIISPNPSFGDVFDLILLNVLRPLFCALTLG